MQHDHFRSPRPATVDWEQLLEQVRDRDGNGLRPDDRQLAPLRRWLRFQMAASLGPRLRRKLDESDVVQQSMLDAWTALRSFRGSTVAELQDWLLTIARRNVIDAARRYRGCQSRDVDREQTLDAVSAGWFCETADDVTASQIAVRAESDHEIELALAMLSPLRRDILVARHRDGDSFERIAVERAMTSAAVRNLYRRGLQQMRTLLRTGDADHAR